MTQAVMTFSTLLDVACGRPVETQEGPARRTQLIIAAALGSLLFAALWGIAAGSGSIGLAASNAFKVPMVILLSTLSALPAGLLALKLSNIDYKARNLVFAFVSSVFTGTLVLAVLAPLIALYYHTSAWAGPFLGMGATFVALGVATFVFARGAFKRAGEAVGKAKLLVPIAVIVAMQLATLVQLIALASPILPEATVFDGGLDRMVGQ